MEKQIIKYLRRPALFLSLLVYINIATGQHRREIEFKIINPKKSYNIREKLLVIIKNNSSHPCWVNLMEQQVIDGEWKTFTLDVTNPYSEIPELYNLFPGKEVSLKVDLFKVHQWPHVKLKGHATTPLNRFALRVAVRKTNKELFIKEGKDTFTVYY